MARFLARCSIVAFVLAVPSVASDAVWARWLGVGAVVVLVAAPLIRVGWLVGGWWHQGDRRFAAAGVVLLSIVAAGALIAALVR